MEVLADLILSLITAILSGVGVLLWQRVIKPFILGVVQKSPSISGTWVGYVTDGPGTEEFQSRLVISQLGNRITAVAHRRTKNRERVFDYQGTISSGQVILTWKERKSNGFNVGAMALFLSSDLQQLRGVSTYHHHDSGRMIATERTYRRMEQ